MSSVPAAPRLTLEELSQLCDEIAVLTRAGVPLETALGQRAADLPRRLSQAVGQLSQRLSSGQSLEAALREEKESFPPVFTALVAAGARSGRLGAALESLTATARSLADLRQSVLAAMVYPLTVALMAYVMLVFVAVALMPALLSSFDDLQVSKPFFMGPIVWLGRQAGAWWLVPPLLVLILGFWWWYRSAQGEILAGRGGWTLLWLPTARRMLRDARCATFCDLLAMLVEYDVSLSEGVRLAGAAAAEPRMIESAKRLAAALERGGQAADSDPGLRDLPPLARMALCDPQSQWQLAARLRAAAGQYRQAAVERSFWLRTLLPGFMTLVIAAGVVLIVVTMIAWPWMQVLRQLSVEAMR